MFIKRIVFVALLIISMWPVARAQAQDTVTVNFSDPSRPGLLKINLLNGGIIVKGHSGNDVIIESKSAAGRNRSNAGADGLRRIDTGGAGFTVEEENNVMTISARSFTRSADVEIQVPVRTNLNLKTLNGGDISVEGVEGEIEATNTNGGVMLTNVSGSVVAHSMNGRVLASLRDITPNKPMSFSSMNGNIDVTLPPTAKANLKMRTDNGETYTDFDIQLRPSAPPTVEDSRNKGGKFRVQTDRSVTGTINGGGPDFDLRTLNGNIYIRKAK